MEPPAVAIIRCGYEDPDRVRGAVAASFAPFGGIGALVRPGQRVLLKPNLPSRCRQRPASPTQPSSVPSPIRR